MCNVELFVPVIKSWNIGWTIEHEESQNTKKKKTQLDFNSWSETTNTKVDITDAFLFFLN